jgi:putative SOS response-associated peptidase YedK
MCGRLDQNDVDRLLNDFSWVEEVFNRSQAGACRNIAPTMWRPIIRLVGGQLHIDDVHWGYQAAWVKTRGSGPPLATNARFDKLSGSYWSKMLASGRCITPADGWYEWTGLKTDRLPWHIHRVDRRPLYIASIGCFGQPVEGHPAATGFALITAEAGGLLGDLHDRRPMVLSEEDAHTFMDPDLSADHARELLHNCSLPPEAFAWYRVSQELNSSRNQAAHLGEPLDQSSPSLPGENLVLR